jgi:hypothetical protein
MGNRVVCIITLLSIYFRHANAIGNNCIIPSSNKSACPGNGLMMNVTTFYPTTYNVPTIISILNRTSSTPQNSLTWFDGSILAKASGNFQIRLEYGIQTTASLSVENVDAPDCVASETCAFSGAFTCNITKLMVQNYYFRLRVAWEFVSSCSTNSYIRLLWKGPGDTSFTLIPNQYLCSSPFDSSKLCN